MTLSRLPKPHLPGVGFLSPNLSGTCTHTVRSITIKLGKIAASSHVRGFPHYPHPHLGNIINPNIYIYINIHTRRDMHCTLHTCTHIMCACIRILPPTHTHARTHARTHTVVYDLPAGRTDRMSWAGRRRTPESRRCRRTCQRTRSLDLCPGDPCPPTTLDGGNAPDRNLCIVCWSLRARRSTGSTALTHCHLPVPMLPATDNEQSQ